MKTKKIENFRIRQSPFLSAKYYICRMKKMILFIVVFTFFLCACRKPVKYSDIPEIKFISIEKYMDSYGNNCATLTFRFQDGDGDIGLNGTDIYPPFDSTSFYYYNFICDYYEKQNGVFIKIDSTEIDGKMQFFTLNARIPRLSKLPEESINGEIYMDMPFYYDPFSEYDTLKLSFFIVDRKLNHSNTEEIITTKGSIPYTAYPFKP